MGRLAGGCTESGVDAVPRRLTELRTKLRTTFKVPKKTIDDIEVQLHDRIPVDVSSDQSYHMSMRYIAAARFKETCLALLDHVDPEGIVITKRGRPVARLMPFGADSADLIGALAGKLAITGDILSTGSDWDAQP